MKFLRGLLVAIGSAAVCGIAAAESPVLYAEPAYQSPVRAAPDDLLLLPGHGLSAGDTVVYTLHRDQAPPSEPPDSIPSASTSVAGTAQVISTRDVPFSLTIRFPETARPSHPYALRVRTARGRWSNSILVNDARPLWFSPAEIYSSASIGGLPRRLKIVGRNLSPLGSAPVRVRLVGTTTSELVAAPSDTRHLEAYVAIVNLPANLPPGRYGVELSRDGTHWVSVARQTLHVRSDPQARTRFDPAAESHGTCRPDDGRDDAPCLARALEAARIAGGGTVELSAGRWDLHAADSLALPPRVDLIGTDARTTRVVRHAHTNAKIPRPLLVLMSENVVRNITFVDSTKYTPQDVPAAILQLGTTWSAHSGRQPAVHDITIDGNIFDRVGYAIADGGRPMRRVFVTNNWIGAYRTGIKLGGNRFNVEQRFALDDSVIAHNVFAPGSYLDIAAGQGAIASEIGAARRLDFSHNRADGANRDALYEPDDATGWRAAFFWHMNDNHELLLVSDNEATCTGDKTGDGESIAFDNNANTFAYDAASSVHAVGPRSITLSGLPKSRQNHREVNPETYYSGHWIRILQGPGVGQVRRITSYRLDHERKNTTFHIYPDWDVRPQVGLSLGSVGREYWQVYTVANRIDHRSPLCNKSNRTKERGGAIALWGQMTDSAVEGNLQYDTDGIVLHQAYRPPEQQCADCAGWHNAKGFIEVRDNRIDGEYRWDSDCSWSGIQLQYAASPRTAPPIISYGISIAHNEIIKADGLRGGAIALPLTWHAGPPPHRWNLIDSTLVHHNTIRNVSGSPPRGRCERVPRDRIGINLKDANLVWRTVTYRNECPGTPLGMRLGGHRTTSLCRADSSTSCECRRRRD